MYFDTYLFHFNDSDVMARKPWRLSALQQPFDGTHTVYVGGTAGFETVEDSFQVCVVSSRLSTLERLNTSYGCATRFLTLA